MKIKSAELVSHIERASMGGLVNEMVLDENLKFSVTDDSKSVLAISSVGLGKSELGPIGVFGLDLLEKSIQYSSNFIFTPDEELDVAVMDNRLVFRKGDNEFKFLLSNPKVISSTVTNVEETFQKLRGKEGITVGITKPAIDACLQAIQLILPESATIFTKDKKVMCLVGKETEHNTLVYIGQADKDLKATVKLKSDLLAKVLQVLPVDEKIMLEVRDSYPLIFASERYTFIVAPIKEV